MTVQIETLGDRALELEIHGRVHAEDYERFVPRAEERIRTHGKVALLVNLAGFDGYTPAALWRDLKFGVAHYSDVSRVALVASDRSKEWLATVSKPFTRAAVKFYTTAEIEAARRWVKEDDAEARA